MEAIWRSPSGNVCHFRTRCAAIGRILRSSSSPAIRIHPPASNDIKSDCHFGIPNQTVFEFGLQAR
jgi:hypothetical protein